MNPTFDPKVCPKCVQKTADGFNESEAKGNSFTDNTYVDAAQSHRSELNRRPLLVQCGVIFGKSGLLNNIAGEVSAKTGRKTDSTRPERVSEVCLAFRSAAASITKLFRRNRLHTPPFPSAREQQENRWLAADCELNLFVYTRPS